VTQKLMRHGTITHQQVDCVRSHTGFIADRFEQQSHPAKYKRRILEQVCVPVTAEKFHNASKQAEKKSELQRFNMMNNVVQYINNTLHELKMPTTIPKVQ
jgi:DNA integrity scanning protein DisA with diadenylate cyclase activity